ncbi:hypothetical protein FHS51_001511 [Sphingobium wenxiniae]|uniref:hypothetical protein n=1 Tax=Sphingobium wenxiniae (strain DSM 21828 / CGMCC 1.7748 / JZ-1) TaxID=595605 RepID=UPI0011A325EF|nr:hypothetical protein [Sphingobium wenxiniae]MBB6191284.1 hypothetical protein [Sphingobium wenxiniae]
MSDNLFFGPDAQVNHTIGMMQTEKSQGSITDGARVGPNVFFVIDPEGQIKGNFETGNGNVLKLSYRIIRPVRWVGLHIAAGNFDLQGRSIAGLICKSHADHAVTSRACIRSGYEGGLAGACDLPSRGRHKHHDKRTQVLRGLKPGSLIWKSPSSFLSGTIPTD